MPDYLSPQQRAALTAVCRTILPEPASDAEATALDAATARMEQLIGAVPDAGDRKRLLTLLTLLGSSLANLLLSGRASGLPDLPRPERERLLLSWARSRIPLRRAGFQALKRLANVAYYCWPTTDGSHPAWHAAGYPGPSRAPGDLPETLPIMVVDRDATVECDVVVVGSGAGGGVVAGVLAEAGRSVVVLDKGPNPDPKKMTQVEGDMLRHLYLGGGMLMTRSGSMPILSGSCLGGGTVINYTTSFPLSERTRVEWDRVAGLALYSSQRFADSLDRVNDRLNVGTEWTTPGRRDEILERGLESLGWHVGIMSRNVTGCPDGTECGFCGYGCRSGAKNDMARTYLRDASKLGARLVPLCEANRVIVERGKATGVVAAVRGPDGARHRLTVRAQVVVAACGALHTPALLARSGISNRSIGRGLRLHPSTAIAGVFEERVEPWTGFMQTRYSDQFADLHDGYGAKFETVPIHFALPSSGFGWESGERSRRDFEQLGHSSIVGILLRDRDSGRVSVNRQGQPKVDYELSDYDVGHLRTALQGAAQVLAAAGAREMFSLHTPPVRAKPNGDGWLDRFMSDLDGNGYRQCRMSYVSFHQMASASMGSDPASSVVGETGESHDVRGLYVADASVFPTSSGVNPMITIMAIADHVARAIDERW